MTLIDTHCHIQFKGYDDDREEVIIRCKEKNVLMNTVGTQQDTSKKAVELAEKYDNIYATIGLHPVHLFPTYIDESELAFMSREEEFDEEYYGDLVKSDKVIAVGETGIDLYHLPKDFSREEVLTKQKAIFIQQYNFAQKHDLPLVIHVRDAYEEMIAVLSESSDSIKGVVHCYGGNWQQAQKFLDLGLYIGFTGIVTFPEKKNNPQPTLDLLEVVEKCPLDRILVETDAPYLAPQAYRGKKCEPWMVEEVVKKVAEIRKKSVKEIENITFENALNLFSKIQR